MDYFVVYPSDDPLTISKLAIYEVFAKVFGQIYDTVTSMDFVVEAKTSKNGNWSRVSKHYERDVQSASGRGFGVIVINAVFKENYK